MAGDLDSLIFDLCEWVGRQPRPYGDVMEAWRTSCPRLTVWEEAVDRGLVQRFRHPDGRTLVSLTGDGARLVAEGRGGAADRRADLPSRVSGL